MPSIEMSNEENLKLLAQALERAGSGDHEATSYLRKFELNQQFPQLCLQLLTTAGLNPHITLLSAVYFKNYVDRHWNPKEGQQAAINDQQKDFIKNAVVDLMVSSPNQIQKVLSATLIIISKNDWPHKWPMLLPSLLQKISPTEWKTNLGVLKCAAAIFQKYRSIMRTPEVERELVEVMKQFGAPLLELLMMASAAVDQSPNDPNALKPIFQCLYTIARIFYSLNYVEIPEIFEDNVATWMGQFHKFLNYETRFVEIVGEEDDEEPSILDKLQATICHCISLYIEKYEEFIEKFLEQLLTDVWNRMLKTGTSEKSDRFISAGLIFLNHVAKGVHWKLFSPPGVLQQICEKVIVPNAVLRESDESNFDINPIEYIRRDIEGSDIDTRRRSVADLVKGLKTYFEKEITEIFGAYINSLLQKYHTNKEKEWKSKDVVIYLLTALTVNKFTESAGVTEINEKVPIRDFLRTEILPDLERYPQGHPILQSDVLKCATIFRNQIDPNFYVPIIQCAIKMLLSKDVVVATYAAVLIDRYLSSLDSANNTVPVYRVSLDVISSPNLLEPLISNLFAVLDKEDHKESDYVMKALLRVIVRSKERVAPIVEPLVGKITSIVTRVSQNPRNPLFNHYLFEAMGSIINYCTADNPSSVAKFESLLFPAFQYILQKDVVEFAPYVFQLMGLLVERNQGGINQTNLKILPSILSPEMWSRGISCVPALTRLLQAYIKKDAQLLISNNMKLIISTETEQYAFYILETVVETMKPEQYGQYMIEILRIIFDRYQLLKTENYVKCLVIWLGLFISKQGPDTVINFVDTIQQNFFGVILTKMFLPHCLNVVGFIERKFLAIAMIRMLSEKGKFLEKYHQQWPETMNTLIQFFETPAGQHYVEETFVEIAESEKSEYTPAFNKLMSSMAPCDPFAEVTDTKKLLIERLQQSLSAIPELQQLLNQCSDKTKEKLNDYSKIR